MLHIKPIRNASVTRVTNAFEICDVFVRNFHTLWKVCANSSHMWQIRMGKIRFNSSLMRTVKTDVHADPNNRWTYVLWPGSCMRAVIQFYWYLAFQLFIEIKSNKVICFEIKCLRLYTAKEVIIQAKSNKRFAGQWILGTWTHSLAKRKP